MVKGCGVTLATVHIVEDDELVRDCLSAMAEDAGYTVRAHATAEAFLADTARVDPALADAACVVVDVNLPGMDGLDLMGRIAGRDPDLPVIVVSGAAKVAPAVAAMKGGALDFIQKPVTRSAFARSLAEACDRRRSGVAARRDLALLRVRAERLSDREWSVMTLITEGAANHEAAARLGISVRTVENHRARVMDKMGASNLSELIRLALRLEGAPTGGAPAGRDRGDLPRPEGEGETSLGRW